MGIPDFSCKCSNFWATKRKEVRMPTLGRKILLVGDLINRGPDSNGVLKIARNMHENGTALIILGNHEFRLIQRGVAQKPLDDDSYQPYLSWIRSLPLFVETPTLRSVHAAWHYSSIQILEGAKASDDAFVKKTFEKETPEGKAVNNILSGIKISLPLEPKLKDRFGIVRKKDEYGGGKTYKENPSPNASIHQCTQRLGNKLPIHMKLLRSNLTTKGTNPCSLDITPYLPALKR